MGNRGRRLADRARYACAVDFTGFRPSFWLDTGLVLVVFLYPLSFAYAVVKHRVMEIPVLLRRSARYVLVQRGFIVLMFIVAASPSRSSLTFSPDSSARIRISGWL